MTAHNHPPLCCCIPDKGPLGPGDRCPLCPEHGELAQLANQCTCGTPGLNYEGPQRDCPIHGEAIEGEYPCCHQLVGRPHTDYCPAHPAMPRTQTSQPHTTTSQRTTCGFRSLANIDLVCTYPPHRIDKPHSWQATPAPTTCGTPWCALTPGHRGPHARQPGI
jgi:hypothetical protein